MKSYTAGQSAPYGVYASTKPLDMCFVSADDEPLQGKQNSRYVRIPTLLVIALSPAIGGIFVVAFPVLILSALIGALAQLVVRGVQSVFHRNAHLADVRWEPVAAYLHPADEESSDKEASADADEVVEDELKDLADEVDARREKE